MSHGILSLIKPSGVTSCSLVAKVKRLTGVRRVGHGGTLDPIATGVLPIFLGQGTRITEFLMDATKVYRAEIELGIATDTYDAMGNVTRRGNPEMIGEEEIRSVLNSFRGTIRQMPPMFSALKYHGKPLYELARSGIILEREEREAKILRLELLSYKVPILTVEVECGKGTYIRSLAHDLGGKLGCGAHMKNLIRLRCGPFDSEEAISLAELEEACRYGYWQQFIYPPDFVLLNMGAALVGDKTEEDMKNGRPLAIKGSSASSQKDRLRVYNLCGSFLGVLRYDGEKECWQPYKVFKHQES